MKKMFWVAVGIGIGVLAARQFAKARATTPAKAADGAIDRVAAVVQSASDAFREGMSTREAELREALGLETAPRGRHADVTRD